jgi:hypothetical protein
MKFVIVEDGVTTIVQYFNRSRWSPSTYGYDTDIHRHQTISWYSVF